jgi:catechol 2,3-dioxygenase-like lactoylglutathione lyase family enzyme
MTLIPMLATAAELTIDHVTVAGKDLKAMRAKLAEAGVPSEYGGPHSNHATEMALTSFPDGSYLELIAIQANADPKAVAAHYWSKQMEGEAGPSAWAVRPKDLAAEVERLRAAGVTMDPPVRSGRERPDGTRLEWEAARVGSEPNGTFFPFLIRDFTPRQKRVYPKGQPTTKDFEGVARVVIAVRDLNASVKRYREAYGLQQPIQQVDGNFGAHLALLGGTPVILAAPLIEQSWIAQRLERFGEGPCAFVLRGRKTGQYKTAAQAQWFGNTISWFDDGKLGWRLGWQ